VEEGEQALQEALAAAHDRRADPATAMARLTLLAWDLGDQYRMLIAMRHRDLGEERVAAALDPIRKRATSIIARGQRTGVFGRHLRPRVLNDAIEALTLALLEHSVADDEKPVSGADAATACLVAAGVTPSEASRCVEDVLADTARPSA